ncbi:hypothetical protein EXVG_00224 [Emiliania huxleyi virus 202]|nr:hypothetical protein EXVG_00224 [Emiliania huxleyi virus 202]AHA54158.1 putative membrane protein [Emiliania huxleyi virus 18]AHA55204.1 putative membrane protein [Emiliania huxleyi virus 156]
MSIFFILLVALAGMFLFYILGAYLNIRDNQAVAEMYSHPIDVSSYELPPEGVVGNVAPSETSTVFTGDVDEYQQRLSRALKPHQLSQPELAARASRSAAALADFRKRIDSRR